MFRKLKANATSFRRRRASVVKYPMLGTLKQFNEIKKKYDN